MSAGSESPEVRSSEYASRLGKAGPEGIHQSHGKAGARIAQKRPSRSPHTSRRNTTQAGLPGHRATGLLAGAGNAWLRWGAFGSGTSARLFR